MVVSALGAGILSLPSVIARTGMVMGVSLLVAGALLAGLTLELLVLAADKTPEAASYSALVYTVFGRRVAAFSEVAMVLYCFGACIGYIIIIGDCVGTFRTLRIMHNTGTNPRYMPCHSIHSINIPCAASVLAGVKGVPAIFSIDVDGILVSSLVIFPLTCMKDISKLRYASVVSIVSVLYIVAAVIFRAIGIGFKCDLACQKHTKPGVTTPPFASLHGVVLAKVETSILQSMCIVFFAYASHINLMVCT